jgi:hypothetical protein
MAAVVTVSGPDLGRSGSAAPCGDESRRRVRGRPDRTTARVALADGPMSQTTRPRTCGHSPQASGRSAGGWRRWRAVASPGRLRSEGVADSGQSAMATTSAFSAFLETSAVPRREHGGLCHPTCHLLSETRCVQHDSVRTRSLVSRASWGPPASVRNRLRPLKVATRVRIPLGVPAEVPRERPRMRSGALLVPGSTGHMRTRGRREERSALSQGGDTGSNPVRGRASARRSRVRRTRRCWLSRCGSVGGSGVPGQGTRQPNRRLANQLANRLSLADACLRCRRRISRIVCRAQRLGAEFPAPFFCQGEGRGFESRRPLQSHRR